MITVLDVETEAQTTARKLDPSPFNPANRLVSCGVDIAGVAHYLFFNHAHRPPTVNGRQILQKILAQTTLLIGHNIKFDMLWLLESDFSYRGSVYDTMLAEYVFSRGVKQALDLSACCARYGIEEKDNRAQWYLDNGYTFYTMPAEVVEEYGRHDVDITKRLFEKQLERLQCSTIEALLIP